MDLCVCCVRELEGKYNKGRENWGAYALAGYVTGKFDKHPISNHEPRG